MIVAEGIVFIDAFKAGATQKGGMSRGHLVGVPPGALLQKNSKRDGKGEIESQAEPAAPEFDGGGEKTTGDDGEDGHPAPRELDEAKLWQEIPKKRREMHHHESRRGTQQKERTPERGGCRGLAGGGGKFTRGTSRQGGEQDQDDCGKGEDRIEPVVLDVVDIGEEEVLGRKKAGGEGLGDVDPALLVSGRHQIEGSQAETEQHGGSGSQQNFAGALG